MGTTTPFSGPAAAYGGTTKALNAYFESLNVQGGINGRKLTVVALDDGYSPPKALEHTRRLVEREQVAFIVMPIGTPTCMATRKYLNENGVPQLFIGSGASVWDDEAATYPWSVGWQPVFADEGRAIAKHILKTLPAAKVAVFTQNDDAGRDLFRGLEAEFKAAGKPLAAQATHEVTDPTVDSQIVRLMGTGADVLVMWGSPKATLQTLRKAGDLAWRPQIYINQNSSSVPSVMAPAGPDRSKGVISGAFIKDAADPAWAKDPGVRAWSELMDKFNPGMPKDYFAAYGTSIAQTTAQVLRQCAADLTRENVMRQARRLHLELPMLLPGIAVDTNASERHPVRGLRMQQFDGSSWKVLPV
ncbi:MAG TPA: ABC transporter substrate-binding protein [Ramlibacter sp.]|uniref:ABC transporter substrate-binding protein n=1 Tax=Ramlibacter sp. TaxID=1917967 RepID=UPI002C14AB8B|nr:ABC transporter substrate-binding protein [Ramlibacter sp.]HVZ44265.1 ABC transporter substrate-binding protein [Ramlibacter sp.]